MWAPRVFLQRVTGIGHGEKQRVERKGLVRLGAVQDPGWLLQEAAKNHGGEERKRQADPQAEPQGEPQVLRLSEAGAG